MEIMWNKQAEEIFNKLIEKIPVFIRGMAKEKVSKKAESLSLEDGREEVIEKDVIGAFFTETPFGFHGPMKCDMEEIGADYKKYGH